MYALKAKDQTRTLYPLWYGASTEKYKCINKVNKAREWKLVVLGKYMPNSINHTCLSQAAI
jgi:hypothetical protein